MVGFLTKAMAMMGVLFAATQAGCEEDHSLAYLMSMMGTHTLYDYRASSSFHSTRRSRLPPTCPSDSKPAHVEALVRHGARHATSPQKLTELASALMELGSPLPWLTDYAYPGHADDASNLLEAGMEAQMHLASRIAAGYEPGFFGNYNPNHLVLESTSISRAGQSAASFAQGANVHSPFVRMVPTEIDDALRYFDHCEMWAGEKTRRKEMVKEYYLSSEYRSALRAFSEGLLLPNATSATPSQFKDAFEACAYDLILRNSSSMFCSVFSPEMLLVQNYYADLRKYYEYGPGDGGPSYAINRNFAAHLFKDIVASIERSIFGDEPFKGTLRFAHAETIVPALSVLGLFDGDEPLSLEARDPDRSFKANEFFPFSSNLVIQVLKCSHGKNYLKFMVNENDVAVRGCDNEVYCEYDKFKQSIGDLLDLADRQTLQEICQVDAANFSSNFK